MTNTIQKRSNKLIRVNLINKVYKSTLLIVLFLGLIFALFTFSRYIGQDGEKPFLGYENLFNLSNPIYKSRNFVIIFNFITLIGTFIYAIYSAYRVWRYTLKNTYNYIFSLLFTAIGILAIILLWAWPINHSTNPKTLVIKSLPIIVLLALKTFFEFLLFNIKRKTSPATKLLNISFFASSLIKLILGLFGAFLLYLLVSGIEVQNKESAIDYILFSPKNHIFELIDKNLNTISNPFSFIYHFILTSLILGAVVFSFYPYFLQRTALNNRNLLSKDLIKFSLVVILVLLIFGLVNLPQSLKQLTFIVDSRISHLGYTIFLAVLVVLLSSYITVTKIFKEKIKYYNIDSFILIINLLIPFGLAIALRAIEFDKFNNYLILLLLSIFVLVLFVYQNLFALNEYTNKIHNILFSTLFIFLGIAIFFETIDTFMVEKNNNLLSSIFVLIHISDILLITNLVFIFYLVVTRLYALFKLFYLMQKVESKKIKTKRNVN
ncbi:MSC_0624 family F1-like ATPase-associated membrane protein [Mycoplasmopsis glycophila]|uniref:Transmembrane protein n=1 Tax=Mycoplasmopsis glycophila TaxID=171285 RepID=A0A449AUQ1_9BACT|nr:hypothetical protein [Mycoplasmopsis glycophila]VEU70200.1 Uncharacterised protein [Mycoplasmopsis glycophila]